jgi:hypothetical protein
VLVVEAGLVAEKGVELGIAGEIGEAAGEALDFGVGGGVGLHGGIHHLGFDSDGAARAPGTGDHLFDEALFDFVDGTEALAIIVHDYFEGFLTFVANAHDFGKESMAGGVLGRARFAFGSSGTVG